MIQGRKESKNLFVFLLCLLLLFSLVASFGVVSAQTGATPGKTDGTSLKPNVAMGSDYFINFFDFSGRLKVWETGLDLSTASDEQVNKFAVAIKWFILLLVIIFCYSALDYVKFPKNFFFRFALAIAVGFLATFLVTTNELLSIVSSYTALGVALSIFFPILILAFFTLVVASKASPIGIFIQKIIWGIYSAYLFVKAGLLLLMTYYFKIDDVTGMYNYDPDKKVPQFLVNIFPKTAEEITKIMGRSDTLMAVVLIITAIVVFLVMVLGSKYVDAWIAKEKLDSEIEARKTTMSRADALDNAKAESMQKQGK